MSRMNQVIQVGEINGSIHYYIEDYAYTYLKKQKDEEKAKYFLYGEKEEQNQQTKIYIYGISEKPKMEQTYFKEYYPLGFMRIKEGEKYWVSLKGQEEKITGFFVFYAPNQAMQEYLVDTHNEVKEEPVENRIKRVPSGDAICLKEVVVPIRKTKATKRIRKKENGIFPFGVIIIGILMIFVLSSANGQKKIEIYKQVIAETMSGAVREKAEDIIIIEESIPQTNQKTKEVTAAEETASDIVEEKAEEKSVENKEMQENVSAEEISDNGIKKEKVGEPEPLVLSEEIIIETKPTEISQDDSEKENLEMLEEELNKESSYEEYVVKKGDTLAAICRKKYNSLDHMDEICNINNIEI